MKQSKLSSFVEQILSVSFGFLLSVFIVQPLIFPIFDIHLNMIENTTVALIFTLISVARGYITRRIFNWWHHRNNIDKGWMLYNAKRAVVGDVLYKIIAKLFLVFNPGGTIRGYTGHIYPIKK